jgi:hypothetical protein
MGRGANKGAVAGLLFGRGLQPKKPPSRRPDPRDQAAELLASAEHIGRPVYASQPRVRGLLSIAESELLQAAPTYKEYRGHLAVGPHSVSGKPVFIGLTAWGPRGECGKQVQRVYEGPDPAAACAAVNGKLQAKQKSGSRSRYEPVGGGPRARLGLEDALEAMRREQGLR